MSKKNRPVTVRHIATGESFSVPRDVFQAGRSEAWILEKLQQREQEAAEKQRRAAEAEAKAKAAADAAVVPEKSRAQLLDEITDLQDERKRLRRELTDANHLLDSKERLLTEMRAVVDTRGLYPKSIEELAGDLRQHETEQKRQENRLRERNRQLMERARQGEHIPMEMFNAPLPPEEESDAA